MSKRLSARPTWVIGSLSFVDYMAGKGEGDGYMAIMDQREACGVQQLLRWLPEIRSLLVSLPLPVPFAPCPLFIHAAPQFLLKS